MPYSHVDMWKDCQILFLHTRPRYAKSSYRSVNPHADPTWKRPPGRPRTKWTDQLRRDNNNVQTNFQCKLEGKYSLESTDPRKSEIRAHLRP